MADYPAPDLSTLSSIPAANKIAGQDLLKNQQNQLDTFNQGVSSFYNDPKNNLTAIAGRISDTLGLPTLQANANTINTNFSNLPFTYRDASRGFDVNNNQLNRIVNQKQIDMTPGMTTANNALMAGQNQFGLLTSQAQQDVANRAVPYQMAQASMLDQMARQATMFTTANQQELDGLVAKINAGVTMNQGDLNRANALAVAEKQYQGYLAQANAQVNSAKLYSQNQIIPYGGTYLNTASGNAYSP